MSAARIGEVSAKPTPAVILLEGKARHLIENFFCKLKQFRAIATRYDNTAINFLAASYLAAATIWLN
jgi:transposase